MARLIHPCAHLTPEQLLRVADRVFADPAIDPDVLRSVALELTSRYRHTIGVVSDLCIELDRELAIADVA